jgi:4-hydroxy-2-oxoheptanedioate aldolase
MSGADLKAILNSGGRIFGTMISVNRNPRWIPIMDGVGLDYVIIDTEHNPRSRGELGDYLAMFATTSVVPIVRIPIPDSHYVTMAIDAGAQGILAPYCETVDQVREVVKAAKFRPLKGAAAETALASGEFPSAASREYLEARNRDNICIIGIESQAAVDNLDAILSVPQIDAIFVGPNDMSISLGVPDDYAQEVYKTTVKGVIDECEARGLPTLVHHQTPELSEYWIEQGARFVLHGTDRRAMAEGFRTEFNRLRDKAGDL